MKPATIGTLLLLTAAAAAQDRPLVLRGARILPGGGPAIQGGVVVMASGRIQVVGGPNTAIPDGAQVIDLTGRTITPGLVDAGAEVGVGGNDRNEQGDEITPHMRILDALDPRDKSLARALRRGVTTVHLTPGNRNVIGGLGAVIKTHGDTVADMLIQDESALRIAMGGEPSSGNRAIRGGTVDSMYYRRPTTRMGVVWEVRKAFYDAKDYMQRTIADANAPTDPGMEVLVRVLNGKLTVYTTARAEQDIRTALRLAAEFGYRTVVEEAQEAHLAIDELKEAGVAVLVGAPSAEDVAGSGARDGAEPRFSTLNLLAEAGIPFAIVTGTNARALPLAREAMFAVRHGLDPSSALDAVTIVPARILGVQDRVGSLAAGKDADLVVWSHDPFDPSSRPTAVYVAGQEVHEQ